MAKSEYTDYLVELIDHPFPLGLIARELHRRIDLLQILCFKDNEYGSEAGVEETLLNRVVSPLNERFKRCGKRTKIISLVPSPKAHHCMIMRYVGSEGECEHLFTLFQPSRRKRAAERDDPKNERGLSGPRRGKKAAPKKKRKAKK